MTDEKRKEIKNKIAEAIEDMTKPIMEDVEEVDWEEVEQLLKLLARKVRA